MKHVFAILFILFTTQCTLNAQSFFPIQLTVLGFPNQEIYIAQISGDHYRIDRIIDGETIKKGTWLITVKVSDNEVWDAVQKGEITGFTGMMYRLCRNDVPAYAEMMCGFAEWRMFASYAPRRTSFTKGTSFAQGAYIIIKPPTGGFFGCEKRI